jgi:hypothetical protein
VFLFARQAVVEKLTLCFCDPSPFLVITTPQSLAQLQASVPARTSQRTAIITRVPYLACLGMLGGLCGLQNGRCRVLCPAYANDLANLVATKIRVVITTLLDTIRKS